MGKELAPFPLICQTIYRCLRCSLKIDTKRKHFSDSDPNFTNTNKKRKLSILIDNGRHIIDNYR